MEEFEQLRMEKQRLQVIVETYSTQKMTIWFRNVSDMFIKRCISTKDIYEKVKIASIFRALYKFYKKYDSVETGGYLVVTLYFVALQLGLLDFGNEIEDYEEFSDVIDKTDWDRLNLRSITYWDLEIQKALVETIYNGNIPENNILGINSIMTLISLTKYSLKD